MGHIQLTHFVQPLLLGAKAGADELVRARLRAAFGILTVLPQNLHFIVLAPGCGSMGAPQLGQLKV